ncbi:MAG: hypothetical protein OXE83_04010 [Gammaproteobacteria bacterium]|nr:hypothetical protein [Gammaproteobacteria bacterium]
MIKIVTIQVAFEITKESNDSFTVTCPKIGCIFVHEETEEAAIHAAQCAVEDYIEMSVRHGDPIPPDIISRQEQRNFFDGKHHQSSPAVLDVTRDVAVAI